MRRLLPIVLLCLIPPSALANSSTVGLSNEGLKLLKTEKIRMASEDLFVSVKRIRVRYTFENLTAQPITAQMAFPFPARRPLEEEELMDASEVDEFTLTLGGKRQETRQETIYTVRGKRIADKAEFDALVAVERARLDRGAKATRGFSATAQLHEIWTQEFPPGKGLEVEISYVPSVGANPGWNREFATGWAGKQFCVDPSTLKAVDKLLAGYTSAEEPENPIGGQVQMLAYVLKTANNWAGPIGTFHLTVEKPDPTDVLSTCLNGLKKTSPGRFELTRENFRPDQDLELIFFQ